MGDLLVASGGGADMGCGRYVLVVRLEGEQKEDDVSQVLGKVKEEL